MNELTLLNILAGLDNPTGGEARWRDQARWPRSPPETFPVAAFRKVKQQRVAIARAIAKRADNLLCDGPAGALDYPTGKIVLEALARANKELRTTGVVISHNAAIGGMADRVMYLADGTIARIEVNTNNGRPS